MAVNPGRHRKGETYGCWRLLSSGRDPGGGMADLHCVRRWLGILAVCILWTWVGEAGAVITTSPGYVAGAVTYWNGNNASRCAPQPTKAAAASCYTSQMNGDRPTQAPHGADDCAVYGSTPGDYCYYNKNGWANVTFGRLGASSFAITGTVCNSANATYPGTGTTCTCNAGYTDVNGQCVDSEVARCGALAGQPLTLQNGGYASSCMSAACSFWSTSSSTRSTCIPDLGSSTRGCTVSGDFDASGFYEKEQLWTIYLSNVKHTGAPCNPSLVAAPEDPTPDPNNPSKQVPIVTNDHKGKCPGEVNGVTVWVECSWTKSEDRKVENKSTQNPDGSTTTDSKQTTSNTECKEGKCTTTTTTTSTTNGQTTTSSGSSTQSKSGFCKDKPEDPQCGDVGGWSGSCSAGFSCSGDAVQCAQARAGYETKCGLLDATSAERTLYESVKAGTAPNPMAGASSSVAISSASFDQSNALGVAGTCIGTVTVTVMGSQIALPFGTVCPYLGYLGTLLQAVSLIVSMFIVFRR